LLPNFTNICLQQILKDFTPSIVEHQGKQKFQEGYEQFVGRSVNVTI